MYFFDKLLTSYIPTSIGNATNLVELLLQSNLFTLMNPSSLGRLSNLQSLYLDDNVLSGYFPARLKSLSSLSQLGLSNNQLVGNVFSTFGSRFDNVPRRYSMVRFYCRQADSIVSATLCVCTIRFLSSFQNNA